MKRLFILPLVLVLGITLVCAQSTKQTISEIRKHYKTTRENLKTYRIIAVEQWGESAEGGEVKGYYDDKKLKLIEGIWSGESGKRIIEYYFHNDSLFFVYDRNVTYNRPFYWDEKTAKENGDAEFFDPKKSTIEENRFYFWKNKLIRWLDPQKKSISVVSDKAKTEGKMWLQDAEGLKKEVALK